MRNTIKTITAFPISSSVRQCRAGKHRSVLTECCKWLRSYRLSFIGLFNVPTHFLTPRHIDCPQQTESITVLLPSHPRADNKTRAIRVRWICSRKTLLMCVTQWTEKQQVFVESRLTTRLDVVLRISSDVVLLPYGS